MSKTLKILYIDMDDVLCDFVGAYTSAKQQNPNLTYPQSIQGFWLGLKPIEGAVQAFNTLFNHPSFDTYILTAPSVLNPICYTEKRLWVEKHLGLEAVHRLIISPNKALNIGHYLVDDYAEGKGQEAFVGELVHFGSAGFSDWDAVLKHLLAKAELEPKRLDLVR